VSVRVPHPRFLEGGVAPALQKDIDRIVDDQGRLPEDRKAPRGGTEEKALLQRHARQLDEQETQSAGLQKKIEETEARRDKANQELER
jgi:hypothetical protein